MTSMLDYAKGRHGFLRRIGKVLWVLLVVLSGLVAATGSFLLTRDEDSALRYERFTSTGWQYRFRVQDGEVAVFVQPSSDKITPGVGSRLSRVDRYSIWKPTLAAGALLILLVAMPMVIRAFVERSHESR
jgi:hypothetical protein